MKWDSEYNAFDHLHYLEETMVELAKASEMIAKQLQDQAQLIQQMLAFESNVADVITALEKRIQYLENNG